MKLTTSIFLALAIFPTLLFGQVEWTEHLLDGECVGARGIDVVDLDGDGDLDIIGCAQLGDEIAWWENLGDNVFSTKQVIVEFANGPENASVADLDGDGDMDIAAALFNANRIVWYENDGTQTFTINVLSDTTIAAIDVHTTDLDGDGNVDILATGALTDDIVFYRSLGGGEFESVVIENDFDEVRRVRSGDIDGDGDLDIVSCASLDEGSVAWWESQNLATEFVYHSVDSLFSGAYSVDIHDMDGDGDQDIVSAAVLADDVVWFENDGSGEFIKNEVDTNLNAATDAVAVDVDSNGMMDIIAVSMSGMREYRRYNEYGLEENQVNYEHVGGRNVLAVDINQDGYVDLVTSENQAGEITWWENNGPPAPSVEVVTPNGGESWRSGTTQLINWISFTPATPVKIELLQSDSLLSVIVDSTDNDTEYEWYLPSNMVGGEDYSVRISVIDDPAQDVSDTYFEIVALLIMQVIPHNAPIVLSPTGDGYWYSITIWNNTPNIKSGQLWVNLITPSGNTYGPIILFDITINGWGIYQNATPFGQWVPDYAPAGIYEQINMAGIFPGLPMASISFTFEKLDGGEIVSRPMDQWNIEDWQLDAGAFISNDDEVTELTTELPMEYALQTIYPNPFNETAVIRVSLPEASDLVVNVYNTVGQQVRTLHSGSRAAGTHTLSFDAGNLASGLYFVQAAVPGKLNQVQKVMLVR
jgi:FG-GAP-like repeat/Secretion system C-terminal sorting domain/Kre9/KNH-like N-terminal Ig-like domain